MRKVIVDTGDAEYVQETLDKMVHCCPYCCIVLWYLVPWSYRELSERSPNFLRTFSKLSPTEQAKMVNAARKEFDVQKALMKDRVAQLQDRKQTVELLKQGLGTAQQMRAHHEHRLKVPVGPVSDLVSP